MGQADWPRGEDKPDSARVREVEVIENVMLAALIHWMKANPIVAGAMVKAVHAAPSESVMLQQPGIEGNLRKPVRDIIHALEQHGFAIGSFK